jgi:hypothetical protein
LRLLRHCRAAKVHYYRERDSACDHACSRCHWFPARITPPVGEKWHKIFENSTFCRS